MKHYRFELIETDIDHFEEKDHIIPAHSLEKAVEKFIRKHDLEPPAYWDEPSFETEIELTFKEHRGKVTYKIYWS
jgi:hypothetical protein